MISLGYLLGFFFTPLSADFYFSLLPLPHPIQIILSFEIYKVSSCLNWPVPCIIRRQSLVALPSPMWFVVQAHEGSFCAKFCDFITSKVKWKTNSIVFIVGFISLVIHEEIGLVERPAISVEICRLQVH